MVPRAGLDLARGRLAHVRKRVATSRALCGEEAQHARLPRARATPRRLESTIWLYRATALATMLSRSVQGHNATRRPWPRARPGCTCAQESGHRARSLWGGGAVSALAACARHAARVGTDPPVLEGHRASESALSFGARPWCHAMALASRAGRLARVRKTAATARALGREEAQHGRLPRARATPRRLESTLRL